MFVYGCVFVRLRLRFRVRLRFCLRFRARIYFWPRLRFHLRLRFRFRSFRLPAFSSETNNWGRAGIIF